MTTPTTVELVVPAQAEHKLLGETYGFWCQTGVLLLAAFFAYLAIRSSRIIERRKAAMTAIFASRRDKELIDAIRKIAKMHESSTNLAMFAKNDRIDTEESKTIRYALNHYEYVSVGIAEGIFDEEIFKNASFGTITKLYSHTRQFIEEVRNEKDSKTTWQEFECLASRWLGKPLTHKPIRAVEQRGFWRRLRFD